MIRINKAGAVEAPASFRRRGKRRTRLDCLLFDSCPDECLSREQPFNKVMEYIYQDREVKTKLNESHYFKCCYCETKFKYLRDLDVEHFRPKRFAQQTECGEEIPLVYFWLAYDWDNLLLSCAECNRGYKKNLFPLENEDERASPRTRNIDNELPTFINPASTWEDPRDHIQFVNETPKGKTPRGRKTIKMLGLRRPKLFEDRLEHIDKLKSYIKDIEIWHSTVRLISKLPRHIIENQDTKNLLQDVEVKGIKAVLFLDNAVKSDAPFSSMSLDFLAQQSVNKVESLSR